VGASLACIAVMLVVFTFGMGGFLANWAGLITEETNPNLYFFQLFAAGEPYMHTVTGTWRCFFVSDEPRSFPSMYRIPKTGFTHLMECNKLHFLLRHLTFCLPQVC
jgi:hypothetical protein